MAKLDPFDAASGDPSTPAPPVRQAYAPALDGPSTVVANSWWVQQADAPDAPEIAKPRSGNEATFLVDGEATMAAVATAIDGARTRIWITDWMLSPGVGMIRSGAKPVTLVDLLRSAAARGVQVRVLLYDSVAMAMDTRDIEAERELEKIENVRVLRHRPAMKWSHHQKTVVVDADVAFLGGLDLCTGRWDRPDHELTPNGAPAPFDAYNPCTVATEAPRMPWHDVHVRLRGPAVHDVAMNFIQRWNAHVDSIPKEQPGRDSSVSTPNPALEAKLPVPAEMLVGGAPAPTQERAGSQWVQVVRSISKETGGGKRTEHSINEAYLRAIQNAQHYVYIENQYFISKCDGNGAIVSNDIAGALARRVIRSIEDETPFRAVIVIPVHPEGLLTTSATLQVLQLQLNTLRHLRRAITTSLQGRSGSTDDYLSVFCLRAWAPTLTGPATEQIYVHSKLVIVDDSVAIIGSANVNDRSLLGNRDSEIAAIVVDEETQEAVVGGKPRKVRGFARALRRTLWTEHFGADFDDPVAAYPELRAIAAAATAAYEETFPGIPSNQHPTVAAQQAAARRGPGGGRPPVAVHATLYPLQWLAEQLPEAPITGMFKDVYAALESKTTSA